MIGQRAETGCLFSAHIWIVQARGADGDSGKGVHLSDLCGHLKLAIFPLQVLAGELGLVGSEGGAVGSVRVSLVGGAVADEGGHLDEGGLVSARLGLSNRLADGIHISVAILDMDNLYIDTRS